MDTKRKKRLALRLELNKTAQRVETVADLLRQSKEPVKGLILSPSLRRDSYRAFSETPGSAGAMFDAAVESGDPVALRLQQYQTLRPPPPRSDLPVGRRAKSTSQSTSASQAKSTSQSTSAGIVKHEKAVSRAGGPGAFSSGTPSVFKIQKGQGYAHLAANINKKFGLKGDKRVTAKSLFNRMGKQYLSAGRGYEFRAGDFSPTKKDVSLAGAGGLSQQQVTQRAKARAASLAKMKKPRLILGKPLPPGMGLRIADQVPRPAPKPSFVRETVLGAQAPKP